MDAFLKKLANLAALAAERPDPMPLDADAILERLWEREAADSPVAVLPLGVFAGGAAAAAAVAGVISLMAATAWSEMASPFAAFDALIDLMDVL